MNLQPISDKGRQTIINAGGNPADFAGYDPETSSFVSHAELRDIQDKSSALAPSNPYMAAIAEPVLRAGADIYRAGRRFPQAAAEMVFGKQADSAISAAGATPITAINFLAEQALSRGARGAAQFRQPGAADTALSTVSGLTSAIAPYFVNPMLGLTTSAMQGAGAGSEKAESMGATPGQELANMTMRAGASAALDRIGMLGAAKTPMAWAPMAKLAARGALEGAATQGSFNVADKVTFNPNQDLSEGVMTSALVGAAAPVALRGAGEGIERLRGSRPPVMQTPTTGEIIGKIHRAPYEDAVKLFEQAKAQGLIRPDVTFDKLGGPLGNRLSRESMDEVFGLMVRGEKVPMGGPQVDVLAEAVRSGLIRKDSPTFYDDVRAVLNSGPAALGTIYAREIGTVASEKRKAAEMAQQAANQTKIEQGEAARQAQLDEAMAKANADRLKLAEQTGQQNQKVANAAALQSLENQAMIEAGQLKLRQIEAEQQAAINKTENERMKNVRAVSEGGMEAMLEGSPAQAAEKQAIIEAAKPQAAQQAAAAVEQNVATRVPAPETIVTGDATKPPVPAAKKEDIVTAKNAVTAATTAPTVPAVGKDAAIKPGAPSQAGTGTPDPAAKSASAPTSVQLKPSSDPSSSRLEPVVPPVAEGVSKNPSAAAVVEAAGAKETTPKTPDSWIKEATDDYVAALLARERGETVDVTNLEQVLRDFGVDPATVRSQQLLGEAAPPPNTLPAAKTPPITSAIPQELVNRVQTRLFELKGPANAGARRQLIDLVEEIKAGRQATSALDPLLSPKSEVASPVATVKTEPAKGEQTEMGGKIDPDAAMRENAEKWGMNPDADYTWVGKLKKGMSLVMPAKENGDPGNMYRLSAKKRDGSFKTIYGDLSEDNIRGLLTRGASIYDAEGNLLYAPKGSKQPAPPTSTTPAPLKIKPQTEATGEAARPAREANRPGGLGSKMRPSTGEEGFVLNPGKAVVDLAKRVPKYVRSAVDMLGDWAERTNSTEGKYAHGKFNELATSAAIAGQRSINQNQQHWTKLSTAERNKLTEILQYERAYESDWPGAMPARVEAAYNEVRAHMNELGDRAAREGPYINDKGVMRPLEKNRYWIPEAYSQQIIKELADDTKTANGKSVRENRLEEYRDWMRQHGANEAEIDAEIKLFDFEGRTGDADVEFDPLHKPAKVPLPPGWAGNTQDAINRYLARYEFDMLRHKLIDQDPLLGPISSGQRESLDERGQPRVRPFEAGQVGDDLDSLVRGALNSFAFQYNPGRRTALAKLSSVANSMAVQTGATIRDALMMASPLIDDAGVVNSLRGLVDGMTRYRDLKARGLVRDTGNFSSEFQRFAEALDNRSIAGMAHEAMRIANRGAGVDALNKWMQAVSAAAGVARAKEAIAKGDDVFFRKVGLPDWRSRAPGDVEDFVARWVVEGSQGTQGAKGLPVHMLKASGGGSQFTPILRWSYDFTNQQINRAWKPLFDDTLSPAQRIKPLATRLAGAAGASALTTTLLNTMLGREDRNISYKEWEAAGYPNKLKYLMQKAADLQVLPLVTAFGNVFTGGQQMPRNLGMEILPQLRDKIATMQELKREFSEEDFKTALDAIMDTAMSNWRDVSKVAAGEQKDPIEQARARYENMNTAVRPAAMANPLNLTAQFNDAKTASEALAIARRIVETATLETPDVSVKGPSEDAAFDKWLEKTNPELSRQYRLDNMTKAQGLDTMYNTKIALKDAVNAALEKKRALLMSKEPNEVKRAQGVKIDWESGGYRMK